VILKSDGEEIYQARSGGEAAKTWWRDVVWKIETPLGYDIRLESDGMGTRIGFAKSHD
jgi:hypothetical protein